MDNYVIRYGEHEREAVMDILSRANDIIINNVEPTSANITIQLEDGDAAYRSLMEQIDSALHPGTVIISRPDSTL